MRPRASRRAKRARHGARPHDRNRRRAALAAGCVAPSDGGFPCQVPRGSVRFPTMRARLADDYLSRVGNFGGWTSAPSPMPSALLRGGHWGDASVEGAVLIPGSYLRTHTFDRFGFRCTREPS
jgi:hypothetical protein